MGVFSFAVHGSILAQVRDSCQVIWVLTFTKEAVIIALSIHTKGVSKCKYK